MEIVMMNIAPGKKTDDKKRDEDNTTAGENCSKYDLNMMLRNGKQNPIQFQIHQEIQSLNST